MMALLYYFVLRTTPYRDWHTGPTNDWTPLFKGVRVVDPIKGSDSLKKAAGSRRFSRSLTP